MSYIWLVDVGSRESDRPGAIRCSEMNGGSPHRNSAGRGSLIRLTLGAQLRSLTFPELDADGDTDCDDRKLWVEQLANTYIGDSNFDGEFSSAEVVAVFGQAKCETGQSATWADGDWNGDGVFGSSDCVAAFSGGGYENGPRDGGLQTIPEPASLGLTAVALMICCVQRRR